MVDSLHSPARKIARSSFYSLITGFKTSYTEGLSRLIARRAVGAVKIAFTLYSLMTFRILRWVYRPANAIRVSNDPFDQ